MSHVGWIDFSSAHRKKVGDVLSVLGGRGVMDELGIGVIRDAFSDAMFPGISTLHTRPKYFFILTRILREYCELPERKRRKSTSVSIWIKKNCGAASSSRAATPIKKM